MARYTERAFMKDCDAVNKDLAERGIDAAFVVAPRNGFCAVDWYKPSSHADGGSGVEANVQCGTPRECWQSVQTRFYQWLNCHAEGRRLTS